MLIDWFTVTAQAINFVILVWLLKRFLYQPILKALDAREKRIADELTDADKKSAEAERQRNEFEAKNLEFDRQRSVRMDQVGEEAKTERTRLLETARLESEELRDKLRSSIQNEQLTLELALSSLVRNEVFEIARKSLKDLADVSLEERIAAVFVMRLHQLNDEEAAGLKSAFHSSSKPLTVRSAFELPETSRVFIEAAIRDVLDQPIDIMFYTEPDIVSGIEIKADGQIVAWTIADYLSALAGKVENLLKNPDNPGVDAGVVKMATAGKSSHETSE